MTAAAPGPERDLQAERDHAEWLGWMEARAYSTHPDDCEGMDEAFTAGMQAARDLAAAPGARPAPGGLRGELEALAAFWVREYVTDDGWPGICAKQLLDVLGATEAAPAQPAPVCPNGCGCRLGTEDAESRDCACDGPCCMECREMGYPDAPSYWDIAAPEPEAP